ncbi:MAG TPA: PQQ-dependent sugar dehydrogenase [Bryobacteraceae bacterium]|nr:PQQ-dependent sugar dehydrogenase [Bryobacteraceae bacterium]
MNLRLRLTVPCILLSAGMSLALWATFTAPLEGQPQGKKKAPPVPVRAVTLVSGLWHPWSLAFLPDGDMLITERNGKLRTVHDGVLNSEPISGVPAVHSVRLSGLMDVLLHPDFARNHIVYLTYTKDVADRMVATTLARGRLEGHQLVDVKDILVCDPWAGDGGSGSRIAWGRDGMLYMTTGASNGDAAQEPGSLRGKVLRLRDDGTPAPGNPFEGRSGYRPEIYTMGHRNSLGLALNPATGDLWNNENGPYGGDEINVLKPGANYGWPKVSLGRDYSGKFIPHSGEGMTDPLVFWVPSIAPSGMTFYTGDRFPGWKNSVLVGAMLGGAVQGVGHLERIIFNQNWEETGHQSLLTDLKHRIRDVRQGPDGLIYVLTDEENGSLIRVEPAS